MTSLPVRCKSSHPPQLRPWAGRQGRGISAETRTPCMTRSPAVVPSPGSLRGRGRLVDENGLAQAAESQQSLRWSGSSQRPDAQEEGRQVCRQGVAFPRVNRQSEQQPGQAPGGLQRKRCEQRRSQDSSGPLLWGPDGPRDSPVRVRTLMPREALRISHLQGSGAHWFLSPSTKENRIWGKRGGGEPFLKALLNLL